MKIVLRSYKDEDWQGVCRMHDRSRPFEVENFMPKELVMMSQKKLSALSVFKAMRLPGFM